MARIKLIGRITCLFQINVHQHYKATNSKKGLEEGISELF